MLQQIFVQRYWWFYLILVGSGMIMFKPIVSHAFVIDSNTSLNQQFTVNYLLESGSDDGNGNTNNYSQDISGIALFTLQDFDSNADFIKLGVKVTNTSADEGNQVGWQRLAFATDPSATLVSFIDADDGEFISAQIGANPQIQNGVGGTYLDIQAETGNGAPRLLLEGEMDEFMLEITFGDLTDAGSIFNPFASGWQTDPDSFQFGGAEDSPGPGPGPTPMPEPSPLALFALAGMLLAWKVRKAKS